MRTLIGQCIATIYIPDHEDFGMTPVESMATGKPVIGVQEGGVLETIGKTPTDGPGVKALGFEFINSQNQSTSMGNNKEAGCPSRKFIETPYGILLRSNPGISELIRGVRYLTPDKAREKRESCEQRAAGFARNIFLERMKQVTEGRV